jgi:hypothetical protein
MNIRRWNLTALALVATGMIVASAASAKTIDRDYRMGETEGGSAPNAVTTTFDNAGTPGTGTFIDLLGVNSPTYVTITGRPDGAGGVGVQFNAASSQYLKALRLGFPETSTSAGKPAPAQADNFTNIYDRGLQFWVRPGTPPVSGLAQTVVMDTNQHGVRIGADGKFSMRYNNLNFATDVTATPGTWFHIEVVHPKGDRKGSRMYINGVAKANAGGGYDTADDSALVVGSNTAGIGVIAPQFTGGTTEFFTGVIDDLQLFVLGFNGRPVGGHGDFNFEADNAFADFTMSGVPGDVNNAGGFTAADVTAFIAGWGKENVVNGQRVGDIVSHGQGDLNYDGVTDVTDLKIIQNLLPAAGLPLITAAQLGVPEPSTIMLALLAAGVAPRAIGKARRRRA